MCEDRGYTSIIYTLMFINGVTGYYIHLLRGINRRLTVQLNRRFIIHNPVVNADPIITIVAEEIQ